MEEICTAVEIREEVVLVSRKAKKSLSQLLRRRGLSSGQRKGHGRRNTERHGYRGGPDGARPSELVVPSRRDYFGPDPDPQRRKNLHKKINVGFEMVLKEV